MVVLPLVRLGADAGDPGRVHGPLEITLRGPRISLCGRAPSRRALLLLVARTAPAMKTPLPSIDPDHEAKRALLSKAGIILLAVGIPCGLIGVGLFLSAFFRPIFDSTRPVIGLVMAAAGGFVSMFGLQALTFGNAGRILRYQAGEALPVGQDAARNSAPLANELLRGMAGSARAGWDQTGAEAAETKIRHTCGSFVDPGDAFCKGCGSPLDLARCP